MSRPSSARDLVRNGQEVQGSMFSGLMPAMVTPFDERGEVDLRATETVVGRLIGAGVDGISALGSTGEFSHLTTNERKRFAEEAARIVAGRVPLLIGVGASCTKGAAKLARHAEGVEGQRECSSSHRCSNRGYHAVVIVCKHGPDRIALLF